MPELPEVETVRKILNETIKNKKIIDVLVWKSSIIEGNVSTFINTLKNNTILNINRMGKFLIYELTNNLIMLSHLRMEGKYNLVDNKINKNSHTRVQFVFSDGTCLNYDDSRAFGYMAIRTKENYKTLDPILSLGVEPIENYNFDELFYKISKISAPIKDTLLNQKIIAGIGNIYADETLFMAKVHPLTPTNAIDKTTFKSIMEHAKNILLKSIELGGSTIKSYHPKDGIDGRFQHSLNVYDQKNKPCPNCGTPLHKIFLKGRGTTYCPKCQKNIVSAPFIALTGPIGSGKSTVCSIFKDYGYKIISSDELVSNLYLNPSFLNEIKKRFKIANNLNIKETKIELSKIIEKDNYKKVTLEKIIHPLIIDEILNIHFKSKKYDKIIFEIPVLIGSGLINFVDILIYVTSPSELRLERLKKRNENYLELFNINKNSKENKSEELATYIINNDSDLSNLEKQIKEIIKKLN